MKIAFINQPQDRMAAAEEQRGSVAIVQWELARRLARRHEVAIYSAASQGQSLYDYWQGVHIHRVPLATSTIHKGVQLLQSRLLPMHPYFASQWYFRDYFARVARVLRQRPADIVHFPQYFQYARLFRRAAPAAKLVLHAHQDELTHLDRRYVLSALNSIDAVVTVSDYITERIKSTYREIAERVVTIGNGVDTERFSPAHHPDEDRPDEDRPARRLLFVGRISPDKGVHVLLQAFAVLAEQQPELELTLVGKPGLLPFDQLRLVLKGDPALEALRDFYGRSFLDWIKRVLVGQHDSYVRALIEILPPACVPRVRFLGTVPLPQLVELYRNADVFVLPSVWHESYGLPIAEAMASGIPVVASRCGGVPELVEDGVTGALVTRCAVNELVTTLRSMLSDTRRLHAMGRASRRRAEEFLSWRRGADALEQLYFELLTKGPSPASRDAHVRGRSIGSAPTLPT
jgi:glycosyltransferase involved in cell wall biosynthesis